MTCKHNNVSIFNNGSLHTWQCADCGGKAQKPYIHSPPFDVWPQESDIHYAEPKVFQFQPIRKTAYMLTHFNETIREIATNAVNSFPDVESVATEYEIVEAAILSAFDEFEKRGPSEQMLHDAYKAGQSENVPIFIIRRIWSAMLAQAVKEMKEWMPNTTQK